MSFERLAVNLGVALILWASCVPGSARQTVASSPFARAERLLEALNGRPEQQRTRGEYNRVLDAFRAIYHGDPASTMADASISAVGGLLAEEGRIFQDSKSLNDAIAEYEFLRREYPGSRYRFSALLTEGEIYRRDLGDQQAAKSVFRTFLRLYPHNTLAEQARQELAQIGAEELVASRALRRGKVPGLRADTRSAASPGIETTVPNTIPPAGSRAVSPKASPAVSAGESTAASPGGQSGTRGSDQQEKRSPEAYRSQLSAETAAIPPSQGKGSAATSSSADTISGTGAAQNAVPSHIVPPPARTAEVALNATPPPRRGRLPLVTGVRHWSTAVYTRVAIDLQDEVQYEAARVPSPDRIFFDLHGARLSPELIGKSVQVTDDGFLKRIRVAQYSNDVCRIVLDVSDVSDYSAFLLPNPYRLIIDIHGRKVVPPGSQPTITQSETASRETTPSQAASQPVAPSLPSQAQLPPDSNAPSPLTQGGSNPGKRRASNGNASEATAGKTNAGGISQQAGSPQPLASNPARPAGQTGSSLQDVANLGREPNRINATRRPTTGPISASVAGTSAAPQPKEPAITGDQATATSGVPRSSRKTRTSDTAAPSIHEAQPTAGGGRSLSRALGLKIGRIVVDAGHGGHDSGTLGPDGIQEKEVVLDVALRLGKLLKQRLGADIIFTRDDDTFIPLETRTAIANKAQADLFISVHANSSQDPDARGVETYYLSFTSSADALEVAARENAVSQQSIHQLADLVKKIAMQDKIDESREFAGDVERSLYDGLTRGLTQNSSLRDRGVKKAPFVVLIGANMPSILAEISFLTNPADARQLRDPAYRQRIAESLYLGVARYVGGLSGVRLANARNP